MHLDAKPESSGLASQSAHITLRCAWSPQRTNPSQPGECKRPSLITQARPAPFMCDHPAAGFYIVLHALESRHAHSRLCC